MTIGLSSIILDIVNTPIAMGGGNSRELTGQLLVVFLVIYHTSLAQLELIPGPISAGKTAEAPV